MVEFPRWLQWKDSDWMEIYSFKWLRRCRSWWVPGTDHAGAILAAPGFSYIYIDQSPLFLGNQTILLAELRVRLSVCDSRLMKQIAG
jgi:hypothetical protein